MNLSPQIRNIIFQVSALLILFSAILYSFSFDIARYLIIAGVIGYAGTVFTGKYPGKSIQGKRLYNIQVFGVLFMVASSYLMFVGRHEWVITLLIGALFILYTSIALPRAYKKEQDEKKKK
ncbi:hypothetical protein [Dysgonomonas sp. 25]|uniref:hypothetical protein n=1 Tax=Dysgonomonas sp. 25 TaxID=2302933 RepID=UPI0013CF93B7|nr:hypothetical protein [Dysgonomonas sp. 25]NDV69774.1 hypothetical protein [Dysgonomonas sp. 25]